MDNKITNQKSKHSQITAFVIIALLFIIIIVGLFLFLNRPASKLTPETSQDYLYSCLEKNLQEVEKILLDSNLYPNLEKNYVTYLGKKVPYLCKASQFYIPCINQEPMLIGHVRSYFEEQMNPRTETCFNEIKSQLEGKGYDVNMGDTSFQILFSKGEIAENINKDFLITKDEQKFGYESFKAKIQSPLYNLIDTARNIVNSESAYCEFDSMNWMLYYRDIIISKFVASEQSKIYTLKDKTTEKQIDFAVKTCVMPAGI